MWDQLCASDLRAIEEDWSWKALPGQREPPSTGSGCEWRNWLIVAGRGFGKTRAGAEWVLARARETPDARIALVGGSLDEVAAVMIEGESGLLACARTGEKLVWRSTVGKLKFPSGAVAMVYSGASPDRLRGPQHHFAWADEIAKWDYPDATWDNLQMGLRLADPSRDRHHDAAAHSADRAADERYADRGHWRADVRQSALAGELRRGDAPRL